MDKQEYTGFEIAVIGMACKFPGASNTEEFWENLKNGEESFSRFSDDELREYGILEKEIADPNYVKAKGLIDGAEFFDASFFGISHVEADMLDPQFRVLLQCAYNALEDANYDFGGKDNNTGVFVGGSPNFNWQKESFRKTGNLNSEQFSSLIANDKDFMSTRLSYILNLHGHSQTLYTACSTSLVAIDMACQSLLTGKCDVTLAGGVSLSLPYKSGYKRETGMIMSKDGHTCSFDLEATGTIWSDGVGTVVLKRLEDALADGDNIHAVIKGSATNNDGKRKVGYTAPSVKGQTDVIRKAINMAEIPKESMGYIEGHGSATSLGDKIEINALKDAFDDSNAGFSCALGSVKSNIGHLNVAAGVAGFIKVCLMLKHGEIPPSLNFKTPNSQLAESKSIFYVNDATVKWENSKFPLRAGVSSFGIGGTNVHMILEKAPSPRPIRTYNNHSVICLSANTPSALNTLSKNLSDFVNKNSEIDIANLAYTLQTGRMHQKYRKTFVVNDTAELIQELAKEQIVQEITECPETVFLFPGMGGFYPKMGYDLYLKESVFKNAMDNCFFIIHVKTGKDFKSMMYGDKTLEIPNDYLTPQMMIFAFEYSLTVLLKSWGIVPSRAIGYSLGEYVAACIADVFSLEDVLEILIQRGKLINTVDTGGMYTVLLSKKDIQPYLEVGVSVAIDNGESVVVAGQKDKLESLIGILQRNNVSAYEISDKYALHTSELDYIGEKFKSILSQYKINEPLLPIVSNVTGKWGTEEFISPKYWVKHLAETIDFSKAAKTFLEKNNNAIYLEVGVGNFIGKLLNRNVNSKDALRHVSLSRSENQRKNQNEQLSDHTYLMKALASLWEHGGDINWNALHGDQKRNKLSVPTYPFEGSNYSLQVDNSYSDTVISDDLVRKEDLSSWFYVPSWKKKPLVLNDDLVLQNNRNILVLGLANSEELCNVLSKNKHNVIQVNYGDNYKMITKNSYLLDHNKNLDVLKLFKNLESEGVILDSILDLTSITDSNQKSNLERTVALFQCIKQTKYANVKLDYFAISSCLFQVYGNEKINPEKSGIISTIKVIPQENPNIRCRLIEIEEESLKTRNGSFYKIINHELNANDSIISYRGKYRWTRVYEPYPILNSESKSSYIKNKGTYIIVGGLGDVGFTIAQYIVENFESNVVVVGRSKIPEKAERKKWVKKNGPNDLISLKIARINRLESGKGKVVVVQGDSTSLNQMKSVVEQVKSNFGEINGIFYSAGEVSTMSLNLANNIDPQQLSNHLSSKIKGLSVLQKIVKKNSLDFTAILSSTSSILGGIGMIGYAAANQYVDSLILKENSDEHSTRWMSLNYTYLNKEEDSQKAISAETLKRVEDEQNISSSSKKGGRELFEKLFLKNNDTANTAINSEESKKIFERILSKNNNESQIIISPVDFPTLVEKLKKTTVQIQEEDIVYKGVKRNRPITPFPYVSPTNDVERKLSEIWEGVFGFEVGLRDDFFQLGGDSLGIISIISNIQKIFNVSIDIHEVFKNTSFSYQLDLIKHAAENEFVEIEPAPIQEYYPLSYSQKRFFILNQMAPEMLTYNASAAIEIGGELDFEFCRDVFQNIIDKREILRTSFHLIDELPVQKIHNEVEFKMEVIEGEKSNIEKIVKSFQAPFDLSGPTQFRACICKTGDKSYYIITDIHHIIIDRKTFGLIMEDFVALYNAKQLNNPKITYKDYAVWQQDNNYVDQLEEQKEFWLNEFSTIPEPLNLPTDFSRSAVTNFNVSTIAFRLTDNENEKLKRICLEQQTTMYAVLLAIFHVFLSKLSNQEDVVVGSSVLGRQRADIENIMGVFVNALPIRCKLSQEQSFRDYLDDYKSNIVKCLANQQHPFEKLVEQLNLPPQLTRSPLFDVMFEYFSFSLTDADFPDFSIKDTLLRTTTSEFDLSLKVVVKENGIPEFNLDYRADLFTRESIERFVSNFKNIVNSVLRDIDVKLFDINLLTTQETEQLVEAFTSTALPYDKESDLNKLFKKQVDFQPNRTALVFDGRSLTYDELDSRSNQVAHYLISKGVLPGNLVGLLLDRSMEMIIAILGVLKTGAGYLPMDPGHPEKRNSYMMDRGQAVFLLAGEENVERYSSYLPVTAITSSAIASESSSEVLVATHKDDLAYCIFTSGSTGNPKGVKMDHKGVMNLVEGLKERVYGVYGDKPLNVALVASYAFDASVQQIFGALLQGHTLYVTDEESRKNGAMLLSFYNDNRIDVSDGTPTHLGMLLNAYNVGDVLNDLSSWILAGEILSKGLVSEFYAKFGEATQLFNFYGPTETCVDSTAYKIDPSRLNDYVNIPIGKPMPNERIYITDNYGRLVPIGTVGELCIAGDGLAQGYVGDEPMTSERFITDWITWEDIVYRTGDLAKWLPDGNLEFIGRQDNQVKLRGYRIELPEIEVQLSSHKKITGGVVLAKALDDGEKYLVAYYQSKEEIAVSELREYLSGLLPDYMVPSYYVHMDAFPLTTNGKIDKMSFPDHEVVRNEDHVAPSTETEHKLVSLWSKVLKLDPDVIGVKSSFFNYGGDSLKMVFLANHIKKEFTVKISLKEIMANPTIANLSRLIGSTVRVDHLKIPVTETKEYYPLSSSQKRMYYLYQFDNESIAYNMSKATILKGILDKNKLEETFKELIQRHEGLRTVFEFVDGNMFQRILPDIEFSISHLAKGDNIDVTLQNFIRPFNLSQSPLLRVGLLQVAEEEHIIVIDCHHIISDAITTMVLLRDFKSLYEGEILPKLRIQYKDYVMWQLSDSQQEEMVNHKNYWLQNFSDEVPVVALPYDSQKSDVVGYSGDMVQFKLDKNTTARLTSIAQLENTTLFATLLSIYNILLSKICNQEDIVIGTSVSGRNHLELENVAGIFINTLALRNYPKRSKRFRGFLKEVSERSFEAFGHQDYPFEDLVDALSLPKDMDHQQLVQVMFEYFSMDELETSVSDYSEEFYDYDPEVAKFDITFRVSEIRGELQINFEYKKGLFDKKNIERFVDYFNMLVEEVLSGDDFLLGDVDLMVKEDLVLLETFNGTDMDYDRESSIIDQFSREVSLHPDRTALVLGDQELTYRALDEQSDFVANYLVSKGVVPGGMVGLLFDRSLSMVIAMLGVLKTGSAYLPLDVILPEGRMAYMLEQSGATFLLSEEGHDTYGGTIASGQVDFSKSVRTVPVPDIDVSATDTAYCIFTSGSTGNPKGVMVDHRSVVNLVKGLEDRVYSPYGDRALRVSLLASYVFDASVQQIFGCLLQGHSLYIVDDESRKDGNRLLAFYNDHSIDVSDGTPTHLGLLVDSLEEGSCLESLSSWILAGEVLSKDLVVAFHSHFGNGTQLYNFYGPTESCVDSTSFKIDPDCIENYKSVPIGRPLPNERVYVADDRGNLVPMGVLGELCIAGDGLAQGYVGNPEETSLRFRSDWISGETLVYRTGDMVRWLPDGNLEYHGRRDEQVKLRGYRIELSEVSRQLESLEGVRRCKVLYKEKNGDCFLVGYYESEEELATEGLRESLSRALPEYMIPSYFVHMDSFPVSTSGKVDTRSFPEYGVLPQSIYVAPSNDTERQLVAIWSEVLHIDQEAIGVNTDFFDLGGNSLKAITLLNTIYKTFNLKIDIKTIYKEANISTLAGIIEKTKAFLETNNSYEKSEIKQTFEI